MRLRQLMQLIFLFPPPVSSKDLFQNLRVASWTEVGCPARGVGNHLELRQTSCVHSIPGPILFPQHVFRQIQNRNTVSHLFHAHAKDLGALGNRDNPESLTDETQQRWRSSSPCTKFGLWGHFPKTCSDTQLVAGGLRQHDRISWVTVFLMGHLIT